MIEAAVYGIRSGHHSWSGTISDDIVAADTIVVEGEGTLTLIVRGSGLRSASCDRTLRTSGGHGGRGST